MFHPNFWVGYASDVRHSESLTCKISAVLPGNAKRPVSVHHTFRAATGYSGIISFNANHCWVRNVKDMSKNKFRCHN